MYYQQVRLNYLLIICIFLSATTVLALGLGLFMFRRAKRHILEIRNMLVLLPLGEFEPAQRSAIEKYLSG